MLLYGWLRFRGFSLPANSLLSDDLAALLLEFPGDALHSIVSILKRHRSYWPFPVPRAYLAHELTTADDFTVHVNEIAREILWWGSNDLHLKLGEEPDWVNVLIRTACQVGVPASERQAGNPAYKLEDAIFKRVLSNWDQLAPEEREKILTKSNWDYQAGRGVLATAAGTLAKLGSRELIALGGSFIASAGVVVPVMGALWTAYDLAGPNYRVIKPVVLTIGYTRRRLRDKRIRLGYS